MNKNFDIIIVGAGLVGTSLAIALKNSGLSIAIIENHLPSALTDTKTASRPISLSYGSQRILNALGVWDELKINASPILSVHVSEKKQFGFTRFCAKEENVPALGFVVPFAQLQSTLYQHTISQHHINIIPIQSIEKINCGAAGAVLEVKTHTDTQIMRANLLIAADGTHSTCRQLLHIETNVKNRGDTAQIYQLTLSAPHDHTAYERFTEFGVLAILPLQNKNTAQLVWTMTPNIAKQIASWDNKKKLPFLQDTFFERLFIADIKQFAEFSLQTIVAEKQIADSFILLGNAAHTIYPVAAQGFNLGLSDVAALANVLIDAHKNNHSLSELSTLKKYESMTQKNQVAILKMSHSLVTLFDFPLLGCARGLGLLATDIISPIKNKLAKRAMGVTAIRDCR